MSESEILEKSCSHVAQLLQGFLLDGRSLGYEAALKRIHSWINNFKCFSIDDTVLQRLLDHILFLSDHDILKACQQYRDVELNNASNIPSNVYYCPFGSENESSARIMSSWNTLPGYVTNITKAIEKIEGAELSIFIIFVDDYLNSGGQFESILSTWFDEHTPQTHPTQTQSERNRLHPKQCDLLRHCTLLFLYARGMEIGRRHAEQVLKRLGLRGVIRISEQYDNQKGIFGDHDTIVRIRQCHGNVPDNSIFKGLSCSSVAPLLEICEQVGEQLLRAQKTHWNKEKLLHRRLGYGNSARLEIVQNNVPTSTLTCLWAEGNVNLYGHELVWKSLVPRREKTIGGQESQTRSTTVSETAEQIPSPTLDNVVQGRAVPFELCLLFQISLSNQIHNQTAYARCIKDMNMETRNFLQFCINRSILKIFEIPGTNYMGNNTRLEFFVSKERAYRASISQLLGFSFGDSFSALGIRLRFRDPPSELEEIQRICHLARIGWRHNSSPLRESRSKRTLTLSDLTGLNLDLSDQVSLSVRIFTFLRFQCYGKEIMTSLQSLFDRFNISTSENVTTNPKFESHSKIMQLPHNSLIGINGSGSLACAHAEPAINQSYLQEEFFSQCIFLYCIGWFYEKYHLQRLLDSNNKIDNNELSWQSLFNSLIQSKWYEKDYLNGYASLVKLQFDFPRE